MFQSYHSRSNSSLAPHIVKITIGLTLLLSLFTLLSNAFFTKILALPSPQLLLSLSTWGIHKFFIWQFLSYLFIQPVSGEGISFSVLLRIFFDLYLLWMIGSAIVQLKGKKHFLALYFGGGLFIGLVAYLSLLSIGSPFPFAGATPAIYILLISWAFLFPHANIMLFMMIPMRAKWLVFGLISVNLFLDFSNGHFFGFLITASSLLYGYFYAVLVWEVLSPFTRLHQFEKMMIYFKRKMQNFLTRPSPDAGKIFDIRTGKAVFQEDTFMDQCLDKIARYGKESLTLRERFKMWRLSKKASRKQS